MANIFNDSIEGVKGLIKVVDLLKNDLKEVVLINKELATSLDFKKIDGIKKLEKAVKEVNVAEEQSIKLDKQKQTLNQKLNELETEQAKEIAKTRLQISEKNKELKEEAKEELKLVSAYEKKSKHLRELKNAYKDAVTQGNKTTKELKEMRKEVIKLDKELVDLDDSVNDSFRSIGKYEKAVERLEKDLVKLTVASAGVVASFKLAQNSLEASEEGSEDLREATSKLDAVWGLAKNTGASLALDIWDLGEALFNGKSVSDALDESFKRTAKATENLGEKINNVLEASGDATKSQIELEKITRGLRKEVEILNGEIDKQGEIAGDSTKGMNAIAEANEKALFAEQQRNKILVGIAQAELDIIESRIKATGDGANNLELLNQKSEKEIELIGLKNDLTTSSLKLDKEIRTNDRDKYEKALDYALDLFDTQKTLNERQINDETKTFDERVKLFQRTVELSNMAFEEQIKLSEDYTKEKLNLNELVAIDDQKVIYDRINAVTQDEIVQQRLLDIIRDRKTALLDLEETERSLMDAMEEKNLTEIEAYNTLSQYRYDRAVEEIEINEDTLQKNLDLIDERVKKEIEAEKFRIGLLLDNEDLLASERELLELQLQDTITDINKKAEAERLQLKKDAQAKQLEQEKEFQDAVRETISQTFEHFRQKAEERVAIAEENIDKQAEKEDEQRNRAENGLENTLKFEQEQRAVKEKQLIEEQKRLERIQKLEAFYNTYNANLSALKDGQDSSVALAKTLKDVSIIEAISKFEEGGIVEDELPKDGIFKGKSHKNGGIKIEVEGQEGIFSKKEMGNLGKENFYKIKQMAKQNRINELMEVQAVPYMNGSVAINSEIKELKDAIRNIEIQKVDVKKFANDIIMVNETIKKGKKTYNNRHYISR